jgi:flagellar protein FlbT
MSGGLIIRLRPYEKFLVNGVVIENGEKRTRLRIKSQNANILRLRDALHPKEATTPVKRLYYVAQLILTGDAKPEDGDAELIRGLESLCEALPDAKHQEIIDRAQNSLGKREYYQVMKTLRELIPVEEQLLLFARAKNLGELRESVS